MTTTNKPGALFWIIGVIALIWNGMGVMQYIGQAFMTDEMKEAFTPEQLELMNNTPAWYTAVFAIAVFAGLLACILLLARKKWAIPVFGISLLAVLIQMGYWIFATNASDVYGTVQGVVMPVIVIIIALFLYFYSKKSAAKGWLN